MIAASASGSSGAERRPCHVNLGVGIDADKRSQSEDRPGHGQLVLLGGELALQRSNMRILGVDLALQSSHLRLQCRNFFRYRCCVRRSGHQRKGDKDPSRNQRSKAIF